MDHIRILVLNSHQDSLCHAHCLLLMDGMNADLGKAAFEDKKYSGSYNSQNQLLQACQECYISSVLLFDAGFCCALIYTKLFL